MTGPPWRVEDIACLLDVRRHQRIFYVFKTIYFSSHSDVVSTVGPRGHHPEVLQSAYSSCLDKMLELELKTIVSENITNAT